MYLYLNFEDDTLHLVSPVQVSTTLKELKVEDTFCFKKEIVVEGEKIFVDLTATEILEKIDYRNLRFEKYPQIEEQLDMLYKDTLNGTSDWLDTITSIKTQFPKPNEQ